MRGPVACLDTRYASPSQRSKQSLVSRTVMCGVSDAPKIRRRSRGQWSECARPMLLSRPFNGRLSPINLSRFSSFAITNAPEAGQWGPSAEGGKVQANGQRDILRTQLLLGHDKERRAVTKFTRALSHVSGGQSTSGSMCRETDACGDDVFCGCRGGTLSVCPVLWVTCKIDKFRICDGCSTEHGKKNTSLLRPRLSPQKTNKSKQLNLSPPPQMLCCVHT